MTSTKVLIMVHAEVRALNITLRVLKEYCHIDNKDIIIASRNAGEAVETFLKSQTDYEYILADSNDTYGAILNAVVSEFIEPGQNLSIINEGQMIFEGVLEKASSYISENNGVGAILLNEYHISDGDYETITLPAEKILRPIAGWNKEGLVISSRLLEQISFEEKYVNYNHVLIDYLFQGSLNGLVPHFASDCGVYVFYDYPFSINDYIMETLIYTKWGMNYFTCGPNEELLTLLPKGLPKNLAYLEIGCDCGGNGSGVKKNISRCQSVWYGVKS